MSIAALINRNQFRTSIQSNEDNKDARKEVLIMDVVINIVPTYTNEITDHPVEEGSDVTDHIRRKPIEITVRGEMSQTPLNLDDYLSRATNIAGGAIGAKVGGFAPTVGAIASSKLSANLLKSDGGISDPASTARETLERLVVDKAIFALNTKEKLYRNMSITTLSFPKDQNTGGKLVFQFNAKEINFVTAQKVEVKKIERSAAHGAPKQKLGNQSSEVLNNQDSNDGSILYNVLVGD